MAEITFDAACCGGIDFYDVSLVDGYNLPMTMTPITGTYTVRDGSNFDCGQAGCDSDLNSSCPPELRQYDGDNKLVACKSGCEAFDTDQFCCRGAFGTPQTCPPFSYSELFAEVSNDEIHIYAINCFPVRPFWFLCLSA